MAQGIVYMLTNQAMPGLVKIGFTTRDDMESRLKELHTTAIPLPFKCEYACKTERYKEVETAIHKALADCRIAPNREFFKIDSENLIPLLELLDESMDSDDESVMETVDQLLDRTESAVESEKRFQERKPKFRFEELGIPVNAVLTLVDSDITITVKEGNTVCYDGEIQRLTPLTQKLKGWTTPRRPLSSWLYEGKSLQEMYDDYYLSDVEV